MTANIGSLPALGMDCREMDAARALLGVSPSIAPVHAESGPPMDSFSLGTPAGDSETNLRTSASASESSGQSPAVRGLDALAALASTEQAKMDSPPQRYSNLSSLLGHGHGLLSPSSDDDSEAMPPPPPRGRRRSASNPEAMENWDSLNRGRSNRHHFVLPPSILEEELAEASAAILKRKNSESDYYDVSPDSVMDGDGLEEMEDDSNLSPDELLRRARSRLLEDLSEGTMNGEKGEVVLPHSLAKYKPVSIVWGCGCAEYCTLSGSRRDQRSLYFPTSPSSLQVYNQNGRIGIYTPSERAAIIARYNDKRTRRNWNKKIRYNCRKSLADRRLRVKGRFVKRSEQEQLAKQLEAQAVKTEEQPAGAVEEAGALVPTTSSDDDDMPDVTDPEAGFVPTEDQPYRRLRRHTIT